LSRNAGDSEIRGGGGVRAASGGVKAADDKKEERECNPLLRLGVNFSTFGGRGGDVVLKRGEKSGRPGGGKRRLLVKEGRPRTG